MTSRGRSPVSRGMAWLIIVAAASEFVIAWLFFLSSISNRVFGHSSEGSPQSTAIILTQELGLAVAAAVASGAVIRAWQFLKQGTSGPTALGLLVGTIVVWIITFALTVSYVGS